MELVWLEDFLALAELGNFSRAAEARNVTQPAFSRRIRALEAWLGAPLFDRASSGVALTIAGAIFKPGVEEIIRRIHEVSHEVREAHGKEASTLRFAATHALSFTFFPPWMRTLEAVAKLGSIRLISDSMQACETLMLQGQAQFLLCHHHALAPSRFDPARFTSVVVGEDVLAPFVAPDAQGAPRWRLDSPSPRVPYLAYSAESGLGRILDARVFQGWIGPELDQVFTSHLAATLLSMAREGRGIAWLPRSLAADEVCAGRLLPLDVEDGRSAAVEVRLFRPVARQSPSAEAFWALALGSQ